MNSFKRNLHLWFILHEHDDRYMIVCFRCCFFLADFFNICFSLSMDVILNVFVLLWLDHFSFRLKIFLKFISFEEYIERERKKSQQQNDRKQFETKATPN